MTFSDRRIVKLVSEHFVPVWESVAPVSTATFELGDGRVLKGTVGGEIAVFFCLPDGRTYDILPALQSPNITLRGIEKALGEFKQVKASPETEVPRLHAWAIWEMGVYEDPNSDINAFLAGTTDETSPSAAKPDPSLRPKSKEKLALRLKVQDPAHRTMERMVASKSGMIFGEERTVVVEPGGYRYYSYRIHELLSKLPLRTPLELRTTVFEDILEMKLESRDEVFTADSDPEPFAFTEEEE